MIPANIFFPTWRIKEPFNRSLIRDAFLWSVNVDVNGVSVPFGINAIESIFYDFFHDWVDLSYSDVTNDSLISEEHLRSNLRIVFNKLSVSSPNDSILENGPDSFVNCCMSCIKKALFTEYLVKLVKENRLSVMLRGLTSEVSFDLVQLGLVDYSAWVESLYNDGALDGIIDRLGLLFSLSIKPQAVTDPKQEKSDDV